MISTTIRSAPPPNWGSGHCFRAVMDGCDQVEAAKRYSRRRAKPEAAAPAPEEMELAATAGAINSQRRVCADCWTSETPLWRSGPAGPKSLCNACGIKYRKRRKGLAPSDREITAPPTSSSSAASKSQVGDIASSTSSPVLLVEMLSTEELKRKQRKKQERMLKLLLSRHQKQRRSRGEAEEKPAASGEAGKEVEEAALLLLSLSSGLFVHS